MNAFDMSPRDFQLYLDERGYTGDQRDDLLRRYRRANSPFAGIFDFIEGLRGGDEEAGLRRGEIAPMVFPEGMSGFEAFTTGQARLAVPGFLLGGAEAAASAVDAPSAAAAGLIPAQDATMEALGTAGFAMGAGGAATAPAGSTRMFAGRTAKTADLSALRRAERLAERGASPEDIWSQTGWFQGVDGQWRFEIDDSGSRMRPAASQQQNYMPLGEGFSHLALQAAYPDMFSNTGIPFRYMESQTPAGSYNRATGDLNVRGPQEADMGTVRGVALHELQHAIQHREGFAPGSNKSDAFDVLLQQRRRAQDNISRLMDQRQEELGLVGYRPETTDPELLSLRQEYDYLLNRAISDDDAYELYRRSAGEAEAEAVRARAGMSAKQRREKPPMVSINEVVPVDQQLLDINDYLSANADKSTGLLAAAAAETPTGIRAYHGSPHDFLPAVRVLDKETGRTYVQEANSPVVRGLLSQQPDRYSIIEENPLGMFDFSKMGTGEGAQAYGWGGYFAEAEPVARGYRDALANPVAAIGGSYSPTGFIDTTAWADFRAGKSFNDFKSYVAEIEPWRKEDDLRAAWDKAKSGYGRMYEVNIDANPEAFLDWDRPLSEQPEVARRLGYSDAAVIAAEKAKLYKSFEPPKGDTFADLFAPLSAQEKAAAEKLAFMPEPWNEMTGKDAWLRAAQRRFSVMQDNGKWGPGAKTYEEALQMAGGDINKVRTMSDPSPQSRAEFMREAGVPGIKYFDAMSRNAGEGSRNYVVFDENLINIVRKYGIAGAAAVLGVSVADVEAAMAQAQQPPRPQGLLGVQ